MTLKSKKNHYNVKLLRGYGVSINLKDNKMILKNGQNDITGKLEKEEWFVNKCLVRKSVSEKKNPDMKINT
jgi:CRISPR-associated protein Cas1